QTCALPISRAQHPDTPLQPPDAAGGHGTAAGLGLSAAGHPPDRAAPPADPRRRAPQRAGAALGGAQRLHPSRPAAHGPATLRLTLFLRHWPCHHAGRHSNNKESVMQEVVVVAATRTAIGSLDRKSTRLN